MASPEIIELLGRKTKSRREVLHPFCFSTVCLTLFLSLVCLLLLFCVSSGLCIKSISAIVVDAESGRFSVILCCNWFGFSGVVKPVCFQGTGQTLFSVSNSYTVSLPCLSTVWTWSGLGHLAPGVFRAPPLIIIPLTAPWPRRQRSQQLRGAAWHQLVDVGRRRQAKTAQTARQSERSHRNHHQHF